MILDFSTYKEIRIFTHQFSLLTIIFLLFTLNLTGQTKENNKLNKSDKSYFFIGTNYFSDAVFMGRKDSVTAPFLYTTVGYQNKTGFYVNGSFSYLTKKG